MQTQINCPQCRTPFPAQVFQIVDAQRTPELKQMLLAGSLNVATCPSCGTSTQLAAPLLYHDSENEMMMVYVPMELNLPMQEQDKMVSQMTKAIVDNTPQQEIRGYMLKPPQTVLTFQTFLEKVYETEGVTPEMLQRQRDQMELLQTLIQADKETSVSLINEKTDLIDETFFALLSQVIQSTEQAQSPQAEKQLVALTNLQARLYTMTDVGQQMEQRQSAVTAFQKAAQKQGGLNIDLFIDHLLKNADDKGTLLTIAQMGQQAIRYELLMELSNRIENADSEETRQKLELIHKLLNEMYEEMQSQAKEMMSQATNTLDVLLNASDVKTAVRQNAAKIDENFMYFLAAQIAEAEKAGEPERAQTLKHIQQQILSEAESQMPPELRLINQLMRTEDEQQQRALLKQIPAEQRPQFREMLQAMTAEMGQENPQLVERLQKLQTMMQLAA